MTSAKYPFPPFVKRVKDKRVSVIGIEHTIEFYLEHDQFFDEIVRQNDALILEQPYGGEFWEDLFWGSIAVLSHDQNKRIYQADSCNESIYYLDVPSGALGSLAAAVYFLDKNKMSRRGFLKAACGALGGDLFLGTILGMKIRHKALGDDSPLAKEQLFMGATDYRNIKIAEGVEKICNEADDIQNIASLHGKDHSDGIKFYLENPKLRAKKLFYFPHEMLGKNEVREYVPEGEGWHLRRKF
jgi:hypothetical protein